MSSYFLTRRTPSVLWHSSRVSTHFHLGRSFIPTCHFHSLEPRRPSFVFWVLLSTFTQVNPTTNFACRSHANIIQPTVHCFLFALDFTSLMRLTQMHRSAWILSNWDWTCRSFRQTHIISSLFVLWIPDLGSVDFPNANVLAWFQTLFDTEIQVPLLTTAFLRHNCLIGDGGSWI